MGREGNEMSWTEKMTATDPNHTKSESHDDIQGKNYRVQEALANNTKGPIDNCDVGRVDGEVTKTKEMPPTDPNCTKSKSLGNNYDNNRDVNRVGGWKRGSDN